MNTTTSINYARVVLGGITAGIIFFIGGGIVNGGILAGDFGNWVQEMGTYIHPPEQSTSMMLWGLMNVIQGIAGMWMYAGLLPRFGSGGKTALLAGFLLWLVNKFSVGFDFIALGLLTPRIIIGQMIGSFVFILFGIYVGARLYKE